MTHAVSATLMSFDLSAGLAVAQEIISLQAVRSLLDVGLVWALTLHIWRQEQFLP
ncbi:hypothetical protein FOPG_18286 [Fusarium oxysporum f. sp. conglutinans race 2 54008]|uniref:Uncharacterized protein n=1 Tax=Fusarium oxysporum f. sp. conglutinans race 2 54008 TaxID=1089457 RepID=X0HWF6_FUSOX|nr:hypothetical protein FOPG_18286 [Fusarium oxysporum f. sp. conglutinans race 2 54008]